MTSKLAWLALQHLRKVWVRVVAFAGLAIATVIVAPLVAAYLPQDWTPPINTDATDQILEIMASSMLAVTTFSLSVAVAAFSAAAQSATPRATALLQQDPTTQNVLSTFLGAFLFSLVGLVALKAGYYTPSGEFILFVTTGFVILLVVLAFLRWIAHLMSFGRMEDTLDRVEAATAEAIALRLSKPCLGGRLLKGPAPEDGAVVRSDTVGYVQHIDIKALANCAEECGAKIVLTSVAGSFVHENGVLARVQGGDLDAEQENRIRQAFTCDRNRTFDQDPRFGLLVMSEIARRALSPAVNDPGTAINVLGRLVRLLTPWQPEEDRDAAFDDILVPAIKTETLLDDAFLSIARDAGTSFEVHLRIQKALRALARTAPEIFSAAAKEIARQAMAHAEKAALQPEEIKELEAVLADLNEDRT